MDKNIPRLQCEAIPTTPIYLNQAHVLTSPKRRNLNIPNQQQLDQTDNFQAVDKFLVGQ